MARFEYTAEGYPFYADDGDAAPGDGTQLERVLPAVNPDDDAFTIAARKLYRGVFSPAREDRGGRALDLLAGGNPEVERYQTWPEKMVRSAVTLPYDAMMGRVPDTEAVLEPNALATFLGADPRSTWSVPAHESMIGRVQDLSGALIGGTIPAVAARGAARNAVGIVPVPAAKASGVKVSLPKDPEFLKAIEANPFVKVTDDGLLVDLSRGQYVEHEGKPALSGAVSYGTKGDKRLEKAYVGEEYKGQDIEWHPGPYRKVEGYGGPDVVEGQTLLRNPFVVKGGYGGQVIDRAAGRLLGSEWKSVKDSAFEAEKATGQKREQLATEFIDTYAPELKPLLPHIMATTKQKGSFDFGEGRMADFAWPTNNLSNALWEAAVTSAARRAGHDSIVGHNTGKINEIFDLRENVYPGEQGQYGVWPQFEPVDHNPFLMAEGGRVAAPLAGIKEFMKPHPDNPTLSMRGFEEALKLGREYNERAKELGGISRHQLERDLQIQEISRRIEANRQQSAQDVAAWTTADAARRSQYAPVFYSAVEHAVSNARQQSASPDQWLGFLRNQPGVKAEELQWMGLDDWLKGQKGPVRKEQIDEFVKNNKVEIKEVRKAGEEQVNEDAAHDMAMEELGYEFARDNPRLRPGTEKYDEALEAYIDRGRGQDRLMELIDHYQGGPGSTKYSEYQLPGGENYRELLLTLPPRIRSEPLFNIRESNGKWQVTDKKYPDLVLQSFKTRAEAETYQQRLSDERSASLTGQQGNYQTSHWDEPNVLVHVRVNDRVMGAKIEPFTAAEKTELDRLSRMDLEQRRAAGKQERYEDLLDREDRSVGGEGLGTEIGKRASGGARTLFLEEVQSDWHQAGRKSGYQAKPGLSEAEKQELAQLRERIKLEPTTLREQGFSVEEEARLNQLLMREPGGDSRKAAVPDAPFKTTWPDLVLKRMVREAAENGYDQIAWTPGEVQAARYDLSKQIKNLHWTQYKDGSYGLSGETTRGGQHQFGSDIPEAQLADHVGKDVAQKIIDTANAHGVSVPKGGDLTLWKTGVLEGPDLKVGGEGMKAFYDKMLVDKANALGKKFGAKVEKQAMPEQFEVMEIGRGGVDGTHPVYMVTRPDAPAVEFATRAEAEKWIEKNTPHVWVMKITPKMREAAVGKGFPLFSAGLPFQFERVDHDPFATQYQSPLFRTEPVDHDPFGVLPYDPNRT